MRVPNRPTAMLAIALLASSTSHAQAARQGQAESSWPWKGWSAGVALGPAPNRFIRGLRDDLGRQGWNDATPDTVWMGFFIPAQSYPTMENNAAGIRLWVAHEVGKFGEVRAEYTDLDLGNIEGQKDGSGWVHLDVKAHSLALLMFARTRYAGIGAGPSWDLADFVEKWGPNELKGALGFTVSCQRKWDTVKV